MDKQSNQATKKGLILLAGVIIGLLTGFLVAYTVVKKLDSPPSPVAKEVEPNTDKSTKDTVVKYVVHRYEPASQTQNISSADSTALDSTLIDGSSADFTLEDDEPEITELNNTPSTNIAESKLITQFEIPVHALNNDKKITESPENMKKNIEIQMWSTPIKNKISYNFNGKILKIKGLSNYETVKAFFFNEKYYLQIDKKTYKLTQSKEFIRFVETQELSM